MKNKICNRCGGQKQVQGSGYMMIECPECKGVGTLAIDHFVCEICKKDAMRSAAENVVKKRRATKNKDFVTTDDFSIESNDGE